MTDDMIDYIIFFLFSFPTSEPLTRNIFPICPSPSQFKNNSSFELELVRLIFFAPSNTRAVGIA